jgi:hypothetical protein
VAKPQQSANTASTPAIGVPGSIDANGNYTGYYATLPGQPTESYLAPGVSLPGQNQLIPPRYFEGDQFAPATLGIDDMIQLQQGMQAAGLYTGAFHLGVWDTNDVNAYERLLTMANASGQDSKSALQQAITSAKVNTTTRAPLVVKLKSDSDIKAMLTDSANNVFGKYLSNDDLQKFINAYHAQETQYQTAAYNATGFNPGTGQQDINGVGMPVQASGATLTEPPTTAAGMEDQLKRQMYAEHPLEANEAAFVNAFGPLLQTLGQRLPGGGQG